MHRKAIIEFSIAGKIAANPLHPSPIRSSIHRSATFKSRFAQRQNSVPLEDFQTPVDQNEELLESRRFGVRYLGRIEIQFRNPALGRQHSRRLVMVDDRQGHDHRPSSRRKPHRG